MKLYTLSLLLLITVSCGKNPSTGSGSSNDSTRDEQNRSYVDATREREVELLNLTFQESISVEGDRIVFSRSARHLTPGQNLSCKFDVKPGEIWHFRKSGNTLELEIGSGKKLKLHKVAGSRNSLGVWSWQGTQEGAQVFRRYTFLNNLLIINQDCEG